MHREAYYPLYGWLLMVGIYVFGFYLLWYFGFIGKLLSADSTYLSTIIISLLLATVIYLGFAARRLSLQGMNTLHLESKHPVLEQAITDNTENWAVEYIQLIRLSKQQNGSESEPLLARLVEQVHRGHSSGWFMADIFIRLGLIGTVIGFVMMLNSVYELKLNDVYKLQQLLVTMSGGMQVALYTTLSGLGAALAVSMQCQWLDRCADKLVGRIIKLGIKSN